MNTVITARLPNDLYQKVVDGAKRHCRSISGEVVYRLLQSAQKERAANAPGVGGPEVMTAAVKKNYDDNTIHEPAAEPQESS